MLVGGACQHASSSMSAAHILPSSPGVSVKQKSTPETAKWCTLFTARLHTASSAGTPHGRAAGTWAVPLWDSSGVALSLQILYLNPKPRPLASKLVPGLWASEASCLMPTDSGRYPGLLPASLLRWRALCGDSMEACLLDLAPVHATSHTLLTWLTRIHSEHIHTPRLLPPDM